MVIGTDFTGSGKSSFHTITPTALSHFINTDKCKFNQNSLAIIGHTLIYEGLMPQDSKTKAVVKETEVPKSAKEVKSFEGLVNLLLKVYSEYRTGSGT